MSIGILIKLVLSTEPEDTRIVCEHDTRTLTCPSGTTLNIMYADYGRVDSSLCRNGRYEVDGNEMNPMTPCQLDVLAIVQGW